MDPETTPTETPPTDTPKPNPLEPGGERFSEVYGNWKAAERELARKDAEIARLSQPVQAEQPKFYTEGQLQAWVDAGQITPAKMANQLAWQAGERVKTEIKQELAGKQKFDSALDEVKAYMAELPALTDERSPDFGKVKRAALDIADDLNRPISDPVVQRRALREVYGPLDRVKSTNGAADRSRRSDIPVDGGGGGRDDRPRGNDPMKDVSPALRQHWERLNYTAEQMADEAKWVVPGQQRRSGRR